MFPSFLPEVAISSRGNFGLKNNFDGLEEGSHNPLLVCHCRFEVALRTPELWTFWGNNPEGPGERHPRSSPGVGVGQSSTKSTSHTSWLHDSSNICLIRFDSGLPDISVVSMCLRVYGRACRRVLVYTR